VRKWSDGGTILNPQSSVDLSCLHHDPFSRAADAHPYLSSSFCEGLAALYYGLDYGTRILMLTAERGLGKTTLLRHFQCRVQKRGHTLFLSPCQDNGLELLYRLLIELGETGSSDDLRAVRTKIDAGLTRVTEPDNPFLVFLDYERHCEDSAVNCLQHLASLQSFTNRLLRVVIAGSPELGAALRASEFADEIRNVPLSRMTAADVEGYIDYRLRQAGWRGGALFKGNAPALIAEHSSGNPSAVNQICFKLLQELTDREDRADAQASKESGVPDDYMDFAISGRIPNVPPVAHSRRRKKVALASITLLAVVVAMAGFYHRSGAKGRAAQITAHFVNPVASTLDLRNPSKTSVNRSDLVAPNRARKRRGGNPAFETGPQRAHHEREQRLSAPTAPPISEMVTPITGRPASYDTAAVHLTSAVLPVPLSLTATPLPQDASTEAVAKQEQKIVRYTPSPTVLPRLVPDPSPLAQPTTTVKVSLIHKMTVKSRMTKTARTEMAAYQIRRGDAYMNVGDYDRALRSFSRAIVLAPGNKIAEEKVREARRAKTVEENLLQ
jgi:MSHA biogenesis protein MshM